MGILNKVRKLIKGDALPLMAVAQIYSLTYIPKMNYPLEARDVLLEELIYCGQCSHKFFLRKCVSEEPIGEGRLNINIDCPYCKNHKSIIVKTD